MAARVPLRSAVAALPTYVPGERGTSGGAVFKLSSNENPFPPLPGVLAAIADAAADVNRYPDLQATELVAALADLHGLSPDHLVVGNGSDAVLGHILAAVVEPGDEVVFGWRSFEFYPIAVAIAGGVSVRVPLSTGRDPGRLDLAAMADAVTERTRVVLVCTPNNPTGPAVRGVELADFLRRVPSDVLVVLDEAYVEFVRDPEAADAMAALAARANVVVLRTLSKAHGLAGLRVGYALARPRLAAGFRAVATPFGVSDVAQRAAVASLRMRDAVLERVDRLVTERGRVVAALQDQGWTLPPPEANFVWLDLGPHTMARAEELRTVGVLARPFAGEGIRVSIGEREANDLFLGAAAGWR